jgi:hypothetical protein
MVRIALRYTCSLSQGGYENKEFIFIYMKRKRKRNEMNERTDEHALTHKSAHLTTRVDRKPFTQDKFQLVRRQQHLVPISISILVLVVVVIIISIIIVHVRARARACAVRAPLKDRFGIEIMNDKVGRL